MGMSAQIPDNLIRQLDEFTAEIYKALVTLNTQPEKIAVNRVQEMKKDLEIKAASLRNEIENVPDLSEEEDEAFMEQQMGKKLYQDLMSLLSNQEFNMKISASTNLSREFEFLMSMLDLGEEEAEEHADVPGSSVCSFAVSGKIPNSGIYNVTGHESEAIGFSDDTGGLTVEIYGKARGNDIAISILADEPKTGKYPWSVEGQIYIQSEDEDGNEIIQLQNYYEEGSIVIENVDPVGGYIEGSFEGLFFDDMEQSDEPVSVKGTFRVNHSESPY
jgi:hypothetical protein